MAFLTSYGYYRYLFMPYGLTKPLVIYQSFVNEILIDALNNYVFIYVDDVLIDSFILTMCTRW